MVQKSMQSKLLDELKIIFFFLFKIKRLNVYDIYLSRFSHIFCFFRSIDIMLLCIECIPFACPFRYLHIIRCYQINVDIELFIVLFSYWNY